MKTKKKCKAWTILYTIGRETQIFTASIEGKDRPEAALRALEDRQGPVNNALVFEGKLPEPKYNTW